MSENAHANASWKLLSDFLSRLGTELIQLSNTSSYQLLSLPAFIPILLIFTVFNKILKIKISTDEKGEQEW